MKFQDLRSFLFGTLRGRLILSVAAIHAIMMTIFIIDLTLRQHAMLLERQEETALGLSRTLSVSAAEWIVANDVSGLQELVESQLRYPELIFAILTDETGHIIAHTDKSKAGKFLIDLPEEIRQTVISKTSRLVDVVVPAILAGKHVGWVRIGIGQNAAGKKLNEITLSGIFYAILAILTGSLIAWQMGRNITARLYVVENTINEVKAGNNSARSQIAGTDEAAMLAQQFNDMLDALSERDAKLSISEKNLKEAQRLAKIGSWSWDAQTDIITWSEELYLIYGFDPAKSPPGYEEHLKAYTPESAARLDAAVKKNRQTGEAYELDLELAGTEPHRWITARSETRRDASGRITGLSGTAQDITERKRVEQNIALLSFAMNNVCEAAFLIDENARFHFVNEESCRILGYTRAELITLGVSDVDPDFPIDRWPSHWNELKEKRSLVFEGRHKTKNGRVFPIEINANYIEYENHAYNLALVRDITERKMAEQALERREQDYRTLLDNIPNMIVRYDTNLRRIYVNSTWEKLSGLSAKDVIDVPSDYIPGVPNPTVNEYLNKLRCVLETGMPQTIEFDWTNVEGTELNLEYAIVPERDRAGAIVSLLAIGRDLTAQKHAERERHIHLQFLDKMDRINQAMQGTDNLEKMMSDVLDVVLSIFECDRAFMLYPCDPEATTWQVPMERNKPEYPGVLDLKQEVPMSGDVAETLRILLTSDGPVKFGPKTQYPLPADASEKYGFKCLLSMVIRPKTGKPWQFGIHQCSHVRFWTAEEERLLNEIGRRLEDTLSTLLAYRNLKDSQNKLEEAQRIAHIGYWDRDIAANRITLADEACRIFGISTPKPDFSMKEWHDCWLALIHPDDRERVNQVLVEALKGSSHYNTEYRIIRNNNEIRHIHSEANVFRNDTGHPVRMLGMMQDITERKKTEEQVLKLNRIYAVLSNINQGIVRIHESDELLNEACRITVKYGNFRMAWIGMVNFNTNKVDVIASNGAIGDYLEKIDIDLNDKYKSNGPTGIAIRTGKHKTSDNIKNEDNMIPWRDNAIKYGYKSSAAFPLTVFGKVVGVFNIYSDETDFFHEEDIILFDEMAKDISFALEFIDIEAKRKKNEELLKQSEASLNKAQRLAHIGSWELNLVKNVLVWSDEIYRIFEIDPSRFGASYEAFLNAIHPDDRDTVNTAYTYSIKNKCPYSIDHRLLFQDGRIKHVHEQCETFYDMDGNPVLSIGIVQDITERKQAEEKIKLSLKEKEVLLRELYHRTKNNMQVVSSMLELYSMDFNDKKIKSVFSDLNNKIRSMALVHQKLYKSQNLSNINMKEYVCELTDLLMKSYRISPQRISLEYDLDDIFFIIDVAIPCGLLINELISNALKYAFPEDRQGLIKIRLKHKDDEYIELYISDNGVGTPPGFNFATDGKMGLQTIFTLGSHQLQGSVKFESNGGISCSIIFKSTLYKERIQIEKA